MEVRGDGTAWAGKGADERAASASACDGFTDDGTMIAAASEAIWDNGGACGRVYSVTCTGATNAGVSQPCRGGSVSVRIVDRCPPPYCRGTIDLSQEAFEIIADPDAGKILITYV
ncbi:putative EG45-like domain containing protein [Iris pallida]|uniref:EG45-like domain containing protein n=1 Tax=Iris pallida TaxID=29817 RepID=A0AAX6F8N8_IRIPA|nr:putative EG45-like domain containing protein [Iris pallida]